MPVTDRPAQPSPWATKTTPGVDKTAMDKASERATNLLIAIAFAAMVVISVTVLLVHGVN